MWISICTFTPRSGKYHGWELPISVLCLKFYRQFSMVENTEGLMGDILLNLVYGQFPEVSERIPNAAFKLPRLLNSSEQPSMGAV